MLTQCLTSEELLQMTLYKEGHRRNGFLTFPFKLLLHIRFCQNCTLQVTTLQNSYKKLFQTSNPLLKESLEESLLRVLSHIKSNETLILKGWKIPSPQRQTSLRSRMLFYKLTSYLGGFISPLSFAVVLFIVTGVIHFWPNHQIPYQADTPQKHASNSKKIAQKENISLAHPSMPILERRRENNSLLQVEFIEPELIDHIEFETGGKEELREESISFTQ